MLPHGTRSAARPRVTTPPRWSTKPSQVSSSPIRLAASIRSVRLGASGQRAGAASRRRPAATAARRPAGAVGRDQHLGSCCTRGRSWPYRAAADGPLDRVRHHRQGVDHRGSRDQQVGDLRVGLRAHGCSCLLDAELVSSCPRWPGSRRRDRARVRGPDPRPRPRYARPRSRTRTQVRRGWMNSDAIRPRIASRMPASARSVPGVWLTCSFTQRLVAVEGDRARPCPAASSLCPGAQLEPAACRRSVSNWVSFDLSSWYTDSGFPVSGCGRP